MEGWERRELNMISHKGGFAICERSPVIPDFIPQQFPRRWTMLICSQESSLEKRGPRLSVIDMPELPSRPLRKGAKTQKGRCARVKTLCKVKKPVLQVCSAEGPRECSIYQICKRCAREKLGRGGAGLALGDQGWR